MGIKKAARIKSVPVTPTQEIKGYYRYCCNPIERHDTDDSLDTEISCPIARFGRKRDHETADDEKQINSRGANPHGRVGDSCCAVMGGDAKAAQQRKACTEYSIPLP
jgi:hypothetical protein